MRRQRAFETTAEQGMIELYPYQKEAVEALRGKPSYILADDMGLGKTVTVLEEIAQTLAEEYRKPFRALIVCPNSVKGVWDDHLEMMFEGHSRIILGNKNHAAQAASFHDDPDQSFLVIHYDALRLLPRLTSEKWDVIIADEVHYIKNRKALRTKALKKLRATYKRALSGTPMVNRPDELWSILHWLWPKEFTSYWRFFKHFTEYVKHPQYGFYMFKGAANEAELHALLKPRMIRREKKDHLHDLPDKYYTKIMVDLDPKQRKSYEEMKEYSLTVVEPEAPIAAPSVLAQLTRLRQFADAYCEVEWEEDGTPVVMMTEPSPKLDALMEIIEDIGDRPIVVFSMFKQMIRLASFRLQAAAIPFEVMTGDVPQATRDRIIDDFQKREVQVLLATIQTGGVGITLTAADTVVFLDRSWSPADNKQAEDRLHRIGQKNAVQVIHINSRDTVDQVVEAKLRGKAKMFRDIIEGREA